MKSLGNLLAFLLLLSLQFASAADIKVMTYNIHVGIPPSGSSPNLPAIAAVINAASPDLVALQEVDKNTTRSGGVDQAAFLAGATGMHHYFAKAINRFGGEYGIAILSKYPIVETFRQELPMVEGVAGEQRVIAIVAVMINGQKIYFGNTHFDIVEVHKEVQATKTVEIAQGITGPFILAGDFNAVPTTQPMLTLRAAFTMPCTNCGFTASAVNPTKAIDHVIYNSQVLQTKFVSKYEVINENEASDHLPVVATFSDRSPTILSWQFATPSTNGREVSVSATFKENGLNTATLIRGSGLRTTNDAGANMGLSNGFVSGTGIASTTALADTSIAVANDMYFGFDVSVNAGYKFSLSNIKYKARISSGGAKTWYWKYSVDGVNFHKIATPNVLTQATDTDGEFQPEISLINIAALQNIQYGTTIKFRLYVSGSNTSTGSTALGRSLSSTDPVLMLGGLVENISTPTKILSWNFFNPAKVGNETTVASTFADAGVNAATLSRGSGLRTKNNANNDITISRGFSAGATVTSADTTAAKNNNLYFAFNLVVKSGYRAFLKKITYKVRISGGGAKGWYWTYSLNGTTFHKIADPAILTAATAEEGVAMPEVTLQTIPALQNLVNKTVYFRLYINGANATTGTTAIGRSSNAEDDALQLFGVIENLETMPVSLSSFTGKKNNNKIQLNWQTASELNNDYFEVTRFADKDEARKVIAKVKGENQAATYVFEDKNAINGYNYYQLKQVDYDGSFTWSKVVAVNNTLSKDEVKVDVKNGEIVLTFSSQKPTISKLQLINLNGQKIVQKQLNVNAGINIVTLPYPAINGIYIISLTLEGKTIGKKINIQ